VAFLSLKTDWQEETTMRRKGVVAGCWWLVVSCWLLGASVAQAKTADKVALWPLLYYSPTESKTDTEILWPLFDAEKTSEKNTWRLLLTAYQRRGQETAWDLIWPIWRVKYDEAGHAHSRFFPLFFGHDANEKYAVLFPEFWWFKHSSDEYSILLLPWGRVNEAKDSYTNFLTPAIWGRDGDERYGMLLPIAYWKSVGEKNRALFLFPFLRYNDPPTRSITALLLWSVSKSGDEEFANLFPVLWKKNKGEFESLVVLPLFYSTKKSSVLFPLYWDIGETFLAIPFYGKGEWRGWKWEAVLPPSYVRWGNENYTEHDYLWPIVQWGDGKDIKVRAVRPFVDYVQDGEYVQRSGLLRLAAYGKGKDRELYRFFPLFNYKRDKDKEDRAILWPVWREISDKDSHQRRLLSLLPIGLFRLHKPADSWHALNLFWWGESRDKTRQGTLVQSHGLYPLCSWETEHSQTDISYATKEKPRLRAETLDVRKTFRLLDPLNPLDTPHVPVSEIPVLSWVTPLFEIERCRGIDNREKWKMPLLLFFYHWWEREGTREGEVRELAIGTPLLFYDSWSKSGHELHLATFWDNVREPSETAKAGGRSHSQGFWPFYSYKRRANGRVNASLLDPLWFWGEATGEEEHVSALLKIFDYRRQPNGDNRFFFIWRAYHREKRGDNVSWEAFPFLNWDSSPERSRFSFVWRLFEYEKTGGKRSMRIFFSPKIALGAKEK
jgi:hypothetical protein